MNNAISALLAILLVSLCASAQNEATKEAEATEEEATYVPKDLDDAVRELKKLIRPEDKEKIRKGEIDAIDMHFGLGMGLRNSWGLWGGSRLAKYFNENGIGHPDSMSGYILEAFCRDLRGKDYDLLQMMRDSAKEWPTYHAAIMEGDRLVEDRCQAILYNRLDYDGENRVVSTSLLWHPDDGKVYLAKGNAEPRVALAEEVSKLFEDKKHTFFSKKELEILEKLRGMTPDERLKLIRKLDEAARSKIDGVLPRTRDPAGLDNVTDTDPFATEEAEQDGADQPATAPESKPEGQEKPKPESEGRSQ